VTPRDPDAIPTGRARRAAGTTAALGPSTVKLFASVIGSLARSPERAQEVLEQRHEELAEHALDVLGSMRGGAMKIGQLASFVDVGFLPPEYRAIYQDKLAALRDAAPPMEWSKVRRVLEREWEDPVESLFEDFDHDATAAASIGQVHRAVLAGGRAVAVKVQYPEIADALAADVDTAAVLVRLGKAMMPGLDPQVVAGELRERVLEELDYELEAQHQRAFARAYRGHPFIHVPAVVTELSRRRVLVSDWVDGARFEDILERPQPERNRVGEIVQRFFLGSMYHVGRFNTDAHPGNYLLRDDGSMAFLDFGSTKVVDRANLDAGVRAIEAAMAGDADRFAEAAGAMGYVHRPDRVDAEALLRQSLAIGDWYLSDREVQIDPDYVAGVIAAILDPRAAEAALRMARDLKVPPEEIWLRRVETGVLAVLGQLRARGNWHRCAREVWFGDEPVTELGRLERAFFDQRRGTTSSGRRQ
jgi:predicted unusual protein kinase regulating ubiquinone biosynthesis (AarF/ABC1/UbiB family)